MSIAPRPTYRSIVHASIVVAAYTLLFTWMCAPAILAHRYLSESDLYEYFLPVFLAPITTWSNFEFAGLPAFADPGDFSFYPPHFLFARVLGSWTGLIICGFVLAASFTYAYLYRVTGSRTAAAFGGLAYGMSEAIVERLAHLGIMHVFAWLPLILLSIEELRGPHRRRWIAIGGIGVGCAFLAGHPQPVVYTVYFTALYAVICGIVNQQHRRYYAAVAMLFVVGGMLASVKAIPLVEASAVMARQVVSASQFTSHGNSPAQMLSAIFPTIAHEGREAPTYVGLATLLFAFVGASTMRRNWRAAFWVMASLVAVVITLGDATPIPRLLFAVVPLYQKFRVGSRHMFLAAFGASFLAAHAIAALQHSDIPARRVRIAAITLLALVAAGAVIQALAPGSFDYEDRRDLVHLPIWNAGIWVQFAIAAATAGVALIVRPGRRFSIAIAAVLVLLIADNLYSLPYPVTRDGVVRESISRDDTTPSVHAQRIAGELAPLHQRALAIGGTQRDAVIPAAFARLWRIPIAGGYGPMILDRYSETGQMGTNGSVRPSVLAPNDVALDLMAVRYILVQRDDVAAPPVFAQDGVQWTSGELGMPIGRPDCGHPYPRSASIPLPSDIEVASVALVTHLRCDEDVPQGETVLRVRVTSPAGTAGEQILRAGIDTAETELNDPALLKRAQHHAPDNLFSDPSQSSSLRFVTRVPLPIPVKGGRIDLEAAGTNGWITLDRVTLIDRAGTSHPLSAPAMWLQDTTRWKDVDRFATSRVTDRGTDENVATETPYTVVENLRALPRAWVVADVRALGDDDALEAIRRSYLPDGSRFDPRRTAIVATGSTPRRQFMPGSSSVTISRIADGHLTADVTTSAGGFLVLSDLFYPGWRATIDGQPVTIERTDVTFRGVAVSPGSHTVEFDLLSMTQRAGAAISIAGVAVCAALLIFGRAGHPVVSAVDAR